MDAEPGPSDHAAPGPAAPGPALEPTALEPTALEPTAPAPGPTAPNQTATEADAEAHVKKRNFLTGPTTALDLVTAPVRCRSIADEVYAYAAARTAPKCCSQGVYVSIFNFMIYRGFEKNTRGKNRPLEHRCVDVFQAACTPAATVSSTGVCSAVRD